jgi:hypothetical protein
MKNLEVSDIRTPRAPMLAGKGFTPDFSPTSSTGEMSSADRNDASVS